MAWFKNNLDREAKAQIKEVVDAYAERAQLSSQFLGIVPPISDREMAVLWALGSIVMENEFYKETASSSEFDKLLYSTSRDYFGAFCQSYISEVCRSKLKLDPESDVIKEDLAHPELTDRITHAATISAAVGSNATRLAAVTIGILSTGVMQHQRRAAAKYASSLMGNELALTYPEQEKVREWITGFFKSDS